MSIDFKKWIKTVLSGPKWKKLVLDCGILFVSQKVLYLKYWQILSTHLDRAHTRQRAQLGFSETITATFCLPPFVAKNEQFVPPPSPLHLFSFPSRSRDDKKNFRTATSVAALFVREK